MRRNYAAYSVFYSTFVPAIVGRHLMKKLVADKHTFEELATISDEALALLGLENGVERWDDIFTKCKGDVRPWPKGQKVPEDMKSSVPTKYTVSSNPDATVDKEGNDKRWSKEGIIRFNQLRQLIIKDRAANHDFVPKWLAQEREAMVSGPTTRVNEEANMVDAEDDFVGSPVNSQRRVLKTARQQEDVVDEGSDQHEEGEEEAEGGDDDDDNDSFGNHATVV
jgi:hypothetical protein